MYCCLSTILQLPFVQSFSTGYASCLSTVCPWSDKKYIVWEIYKTCYTTSTLLWTLAWLFVLTAHCSVESLASNAGILYSLLREQALPCIRKTEETNEVWGIMRPQEKEWSLRTWRLLPDMERKLAYPEWVAVVTKIITLVVNWPSWPIMKDEAQSNLIIQAFLLFRHFHWSWVCYQYFIQYFIVIISQDDYY